MKHNNLTTILNMVNNSYRYYKLNQDEKNLNLKNLYIKHYLNSVDFLSYSIIKGYVNSDDSFNIYRDNFLNIFNDEVLKKYIFDKDYKYIILLKEKFFKNEKFDDDRYSNSQEFLDKIEKKEEN